MEVDDSESGAIAWEYATFGQCRGCSGKSLDKIIQETTPMGTIHYTYDALGRRTSMTVAGDARVNYGYDAGSRLTEIDRSDLGTVGIGYDAANRRTSLSLPNGVSTQYGYDDSSRLLGMTHKNLSGTIESLNYVSDPAGNRISLQSLIPRTELPEAVTAAYDAANRLLTFNDRNFIYDPNGNMVEKREAAGTTFYTWDARNRLVSIEGPQVSARFRYDAFNRRIEKSVNNKTTHYQYDGKDIIAEMEEGFVTARYLRSLYIDEPFARMDNTGVRFYTADGLGSTIALTDANGAVKTQYLYGPYGSTTAVGDPSENPFQYTGRENDGTGLYYYRARYYDPVLGRFISEDPIRPACGDFNLHAYVQNDQMNDNAH